VAKTGTSPHTHGKSEIWERPDVAAAIRRTCRGLGSHLRKLRHERKLSLHAAAEKAGLHDKHLQRIETAATKNVSVASLVAITRAYGVDLVTLFAAVSGTKVRSRRNTVTAS
jgi:hypothetical protein